MPSKPVAGALVLLAILAGVANWAGANADPEATAAPHLVSGVVVLVDGAEVRTFSVNDTTCARTRTTSDSCSSLVVRRALMTTAPTDALEAMRAEMEVGQQERRAVTVRYLSGDHVLAEIVTERALLIGYEVDAPTRARDSPAFETFTLALPDVRFTMQPSVVG